MGLPIRDHAAGSLSPVALTRAIGSPNFQLFQGDPRQGAEKPLGWTVRTVQQRGNPSNLIRFTPA